jgi:ABC-type Fe3+ transport system substrate-binding protein
MNRWFRRLAPVCLLALTASPAAVAADAALIEAAKKEGQVVWYTTQQVDPLVRPVAEAFRTKYGIRVDYIRADSSDVALRILNEGQAGRMQSDVFDGTAAAATLKKHSMVEKWLPDSARELPPSYLDPDGSWAATNLFVVTPGYNTDLVPEGAAPRRFEDLLDPRWKGVMTWPTTPSASAAPGFVGLVLDEMGPDCGTDYLKRLAGQNITGIKASARQVLDQVIAGDYAIGLQMFNHATVLSGQRGAPVSWIAMNPALTTFNTISLTKGGPHPNAGKLLMDFALSAEGQALFRKGGVITVHPDVPPFDPSLRPDGTRFRARQYTPEALEASLPIWIAKFAEIFR